MKLRTCSRVVGKKLFKGSPKEKYWTARIYFGLIRRMLRPSNRPFLRRVAKDSLRFVLDAVHPVEGETRERAKAAVGWILRAQDATPDGGVSFGYFPCDGGDGTGWRPSYPETTGYIIPSLLECSERFQEEKVRRRALQMAVWETEVQMASGAIQGGPVCRPQDRVPSAFNTGMVLHGFTAAYRETRDTLFLNAGRRAADFLVADLGPDGHFRTHGPFVAQHRIKTYDCLCAWALYRFGEDAGAERYKRTALRVVEAAIGQQQANGWFANNCLSNPEAPLLHTIAYTLQGILEVGILAQREDFVEAVRRGTAPLLDRVSRKGFLHGRFYSDWEPAVFFSCLTGNAQVAVICYRLHGTTGDARYRAVADRLLNYLKALQAMDSPEPAINGAIPGSFPLMGSYMTAGYPNWAAKFFLDGLLFQGRLEAA